MAFRYESMKVTSNVRVFIKDIYILTKQLPPDERFSLIQQLQRASTSILLNLAEGSARKTPKEFSRFLTMSLGSAIECHAALTISLDLGYITKVTFKKYRVQIEDIWIQLCAIRNSQQR